MATRTAPIAEECSSSRCRLVRLLNAHKQEIVDWVTAQMQTSPESTPEYSAFLASREGRRRIARYVALAIRAIVDPHPFFVDQEYISKLRAAQGYPLSGVLDVSIQTKKAIWNVLLSHLAGCSQSVPVSLLMDLRALEAALDASRVILARGYVAAREEKIRVQREHLDSMYNLASSAFSSRDFSATMSDLMDTAKAVFEAEECGVVLLKKMTEFNTSGGVTFKTLSPKTAQRIRLVLSSSSPTSIRVRVQRGQATRLEHWLVSRIAAYGEPIGVMYVCRPRMSGPGEMNLLQSFASALAGAIANSNLFRALAEKEQVLSELVRNTVQAQEAERKWLAAEIHDGPTQTLMAAMYRLEACEMSLSVSDKAALHELKMARQSIAHTVEDMRRIISNLRPLVLDDLGLMASIRSLAKAFMDEGGPRIEVREHGSSLRLCGDYELVLYRIVQESLNNIRRHSRATRVTITLTYEKNRVRLEIADNGLGFDLRRSLNELAQQGKFGLIGMRERVERLGGDFRVRAHPNAGTSVEVELPC